MCRLGKPSGLLRVDPSSVLMVVRSTSAAEWTAHDFSPLPNKGVLFALLVHQSWVARLLLVVGLG